MRGLESVAVVWLSAIGILLTLLPITVLAGTLLRLLGGFVASMLGLVAAIPMLTLMLLRAGGLIRHRHAVPRPTTAGLLGLLRNVAIVARLAQRGDGAAARESDPADGRRARWW